MHEVDLCYFRSFCIFFSEGHKDLGELTSSTNPTKYINTILYLCFCPSLVLKPTTFRSNTAHTEKKTRKKKKNKKLRTRSNRVADNRASRFTEGSETGQAERRVLFPAKDKNKIRKRRKINLEFIEGSFGSHVVIIIVIILIIMIIIENSNKINNNNNDDDNRNDENDIRIIVLIRTIVVIEHVMKVTMIIIILTILKKSELREQICLV